MPNIYCYMFEAKSIQSYIFRTGKLRDVIAASERLDQLIDTNENSVLSKLLILPGSPKIELHFIRRKGGAFYVYSEKQEGLKYLRKIWTLIVQQLFPTMDFIDGLACGVNLVDAMDKTHSQLSASRNKPTIKMPLFKANMKLAARTAHPAVPFSNIIKHQEKIIDADTNINRHTYELMKQGSYEQFLYKKFIDEKHINKDNNLNRVFPLDLNPQDQTTNDNSKDTDPNKFPYSDNKNDLALIHIDGNGIGNLLTQLKDQLRLATHDDYKGIFRGFSNVLCDSTEAAAKVATENLIATYDKEKKSSLTLPMRPLVMGGDDITLFCRSDLALIYANDFCIAFQEQTKQKLSVLYNKFNKLNNLDLSELPESLTASGGIVFQKATQPFTTAHHLVEELCRQAKITSKANTIDGEKDGTGMPAIAFMRIATAQDDNYQRLLKDGYQIQFNKKTISTSIGNYIVTDSQDKTVYSKPKLQDLIDLVAKISDKDSSLLISLFRKVLTQLHHGNIDEAEQLINRAENIAEKSTQEIKKIFNFIKGNKAGKWWLWDIDETNQNQETILDDIITLAKFKGEKS